MLCPSLTGTSAQALADHIRAVPTAAEPIVTAHSRWSLTASVGISAVVAGERVDLPLARADQALTQARSVGRARIQVYDASTHRFAADQIDLFCAHPGDEAGDRPHKDGDAD